MAAINATLSHLLFSTDARVPTSKSVPETAYRRMRRYPQAENVGTAGGHVFSVTLEDAKRAGVRLKRGLRP